MTSPAVIAHRGASGLAHENTLEAFLLAQKLRADAVELDVHATVDGVLVVHHDSMVRGLGVIEEHSHQHFLGYRLPNGEPIPTLHEVLEALGAFDVWIEVKALAAQWDDQLLNVIRSGPSPERYAVHSFDCRIVARLGGAAPGLRRGVLQTSYPLDVLACLSSTGASVLWQQTHLIDAQMVEILHANGKQVVAWTTDDEVEIARLVQIGVDGICGNFPERIRAALIGAERTFKADIPLVP